MNMSNTDPHVDTLHGVNIVDPCRWLEERTCESTQRWIEAQQRRNADYFQFFSDMETLRERVTHFLNRETVLQPSKVGNYLFFCRRSGVEEQASIWMMDSATGEEHILVDPSSEGRFVSVSIYRISQDGSILSFATKVGGETKESIRFVDIATRQILKESLEKGYARGLVFAPDGFFYCHEGDFSARTSASHEVRYHHFGHSIIQDEVLLSIPRSSESRLVLTSDNIHLGAIFVSGNDSGCNAGLYLASRGKITSWRHVSIDEHPPCFPFLHEGRIFLISFFENPNGSVLEFHEGRCKSTLVVPAWEAPIENLHLAGDCLYVSYRDYPRTIIHRWNLAGEFLEQLPDHPEGSFRMLPSYTESNESLFLEHESFFEPPSLLEYCDKTKSYVPRAERGECCVSRHYPVRRVWYPSKDGTEIPMWLVGHENSEQTGSRPVILTAYGGFGVSVTPRFSVLVTVLLELGCVFALPNIRGGSEFGRKWHDAGRRRNRQTAYDDFLSAAEWLCQSSIATPERLAIFGGSNSGLLVAVAMTQKPSLFRAVLCMSPILDMLRYEKLNNAGKWKEEFGSVEDAEDFPVLYSYSPYHHVRDEVDYPATLFVTGDKDEQCNPAHVRKMAERLLGRQVQSRPILVDYSSERGHCAVLPLSVRIKALTQRIAFLSKELGIEFPGDSARANTTRS